MQAVEGAPLPLADGGEWRMQEAGGREARVERRDGAPRHWAERVDAWLLRRAAARTPDATGARARFCCYLLPSTLEHHTDV